MMYDSIAMTVAVGKQLLKMGRIQRFKALSIKKSGRNFTVGTSVIDTDIVQGAKHGKVGTGKMPASDQ